MGMKKTTTTERKKERKKERTKERGRTGPTSKIARFMMSFLALG